jgi:flagellar hook assembly protein FlgD
MPYYLQENARVKIEVYDVSGEKIRSLDPFAGQAGNNEEFWDEKNSYGQKVASGVFIYRVIATDQKGDTKSAFAKCAVLR